MKKGESTRCGCSPLKITSHFLLSSVARVFFSCLTSYSKTDENPTDMRRRQSLKDYVFLKVTLCC
jgi:hypothetical protein